MARSRILLALPLAVLLAGCAATPPLLDPTPTPTVDDGCAAPGPASEAVAVSGLLGAPPVIAADGPFDVDRVERTVLREGEGDPVEEGDFVEVAITMVNATSGDQAPGTARVRVLIEEGAAQPGLLATIRCTPVGSRVVGVVPSSAAYGSAGQPDLAIGPDDDIVFVVDVLDLVALQASGEPQPLPEDFPAVEIVVSPDEGAAIRVPEADPPAELRAATVIVGRGAEVASGDEVLVQFQAVNWRTGEVFDETWGDAPRSLLTILPGVDRSLLGQTVGSRVVVVVPPGDGFGSSGSPSSGVSGTDTVVYVVDILATTPAPA